MSAVAPERTGSCVRIQLVGSSVLEIAEDRISMFAELAGRIYSRVIDPAAINFRLDGSLRCATIWLCMANNRRPPSDVLPMSYVCTIRHSIEQNVTNEEILGFQS